MAWIGMTDPELDRMVKQARLRPFTKFAKAMEQVKVERARWQELWIYSEECNRRAAEFEEALRLIACGKTGSYGSARDLACAVLEEAS